MRYVTLGGPVGFLTVFEESGRIVAIEFGRAPDPVETPLLRAAKEQLEAYLAGRLTRFDLPLAPAGSVFQRRVWDAMREIPYGATRTYGDLATALGSAPRAVGSASARNPIPLIIPCHRVVGADGSLRGYSAGDGIETKRWLLRMEGASETPGGN